MYNFCKFFKNLYGKPTMTKEQLSKLIPSKQRDDINHLQELLDNYISSDELDAAIKQLKLGKAVGEDLVANEFLKASKATTRNTICHLFNESLRIGIYPWNNSLITPIHKKGDIYDPNNYRAIAVASNLGKLFALILLERLITYRASANPDTANQRGFVKNAQTNDHILTLSTCINKYINPEYANKKRVFTCFVDYTKAFDTVCREALLLYIKYGNLVSEVAFSNVWSICTATQQLKLNCLINSQKKLTSFVVLNKGTPCHRNYSSYL